MWKKLWWGCASLDPPYFPAGHTGHFRSISTSTFVPLEVTSNTGESLLSALSFSN